MQLEAITNTGASYSTDTYRQNNTQSTNKSSEINNSPNGTQVVSPTQTTAAASVNNDSQGQDSGTGQGGKSGQQPSQKFVSQAVENANSHMPVKTKCEFAYDETTKRISITIKDKETDEVIREVPPKETLEMVAKMWELAGILVDEKR